MRLFRRSWPALVAGAGFVALLAACESPPPPVSGSKTEATVTGSVKIRGKAPAKGKVRFDPANSSRPDAPVATADIGADGKYTAKTLVGKNRVTVDSPETAKDRTLAYEQIELDVKDGENSFDITLPAPK